ncbi:sphingosine-1-phosphate phosphohydrolase [Planoprotostelium fungivorum]|uniref:Sphingosine-1-phosphate phosphohydrolase n=1 Tax=Planoprotostelium fungivorum TaxID=1890364 RepID=A0A2P6NN60_9EUKA|nr:sphingosine-1-phosphate phosphohydrolase [Planoprotostelium fungivorum]
MEGHHHSGHNHETSIPKKINQNERMKHRIVQNTTSNGNHASLTNGKRPADVEHERENIAEDPEAFRGFRKRIRNWLLPQVKQGIHRIVDIQSTRNPTKTSIFEFVSNSGTANFQIAFFPYFWFGLGDAFVGRQLLFIISLGIYSGNWLKDFFCLPRPSQPALRLSYYGSKEFGFPSTHAISAMNLAAALLVLLAGPFTTAFWIGLPFAITYVCLVCYSRVYLGMHCLTDILGGLAVSSTIIAIWYGLGVYLIIDDYVLTSSTTIVVSIIFGILILYFHPEPVVYCPCFEDTTCSVGAAIGIACSACLTGDFIEWKHNDQYIMIFRYIFGVALLILTRFIAKPIMYKIIPWFYENFDFQGRRFLPHLSSRTPVQLKMKVVPSLNNLHDKENKKPPHDVDIPSKYIVYMLMTASVAVSCLIMQRIPYIN